MIVHLFNTVAVSGPERLVLPAIANFQNDFIIVNLLEDRNERLRESDPLEEYARSLNLDYRAIGVRKRWDPVAFRELRVLLEHLKPDLVHTHGVKASLYLLQAKRDGIRRPFRMVSTHHGVRGLPDMKTRLYDLFYRRYVLKYFDRILCVSTEDYETLGRSGIGEDRRRLHLNGIDGVRIDASRRVQVAQKIRRRWLPNHLHPDTLFLFGAVGRLSAEKDQTRLLKVLFHLNSQPSDRDWRCLIFGNGSMDKYLQDLAHRLELSGRVHWMGYRKNVGDELAGLDVVLSFSKAEGLPINLLEAGWAGTPVIATPVGGVIDLIPDERYGTWVPLDEPADATALRLRACLSEEGRSKLQLQARCFQERMTIEFTQAKWVNRLEDIYAELGVRLTHTTYGDEMKIYATQSK